MRPLLLDVSVRSIVYDLAGQPSRNFARKESGKQLGRSA
jgi:hypothetical protein